MSKGTLSTLDFVISVLREHERDLTELGDKLEEVLSISIGGMKKDLDEIRSILNELNQKIGTLNSPLIETLLSQLVNQVTLQNQTIKLLIDGMKESPTKDEIKELKTSLSSIHRSIAKLSG